jgi:hypothetical protein
MIARPNVQIWAEAEWPELVESGPSVLEAGPQETGRTGIPDASVFCIAGSRGLLQFFG